MFRVFDDDGNGTMDFQEYILALNATKQDNKILPKILMILYWLGTPEEKLKWIFNVFDKDGGGSIDAKEIQWMVSGLFAMAGVRLYLTHT